MFFSDPHEAIRATFYGDYRYNDEFIRFNVYGNLDSYNSFEIVDEAKRDNYFLRWLFDNYSNIDDLGELIEFLSSNEKEICKRALIICQ